MTLKPRKITLTKHQQQALNLLARAHRRIPNQGYCGTFSAGETHLDSWPAFINYRTGRALLAKGLITVVDTGPEYTDVALTERGWELSR